MPALQRYSILCPNCRKLISADEEVCPYCGTTRPASPWKNFIRNTFSPRADHIITYIIYANIFMYVVSLLFSSTGIGLSANPLAFLSPSSSSLLLLGATGTLPIDQFNRWWTLITANYLHGGLLHIFFNMMALKQLAPVTLREYGIHRMIVIYTMGGIIGYLVSYFAGVRFTIGASAAVCSIIGAILYYGKSRGGTYGQALYKEVSGWVLGLFLFGLVVPGINNWGHGGGILGGILTGWLLGYREKRRDNLIHVTSAAVCILFTLAALAFAILSAFYYSLSG